MRRPQTVPPDLVVLSERYGQGRVDYYASDEGQRSASRQVSGDYGAEKDPVRQAQGRIGEIVVARYFGLDPLRALGWNPKAGGDGGFDVRLLSGIRLDIKTTLPPRLLIWSKEKNHLYQKTAFDALVAVSVAIDDLSRCWIDGYVPKPIFFARKRIADGTNGLAVGTWWMPKGELADIERLLEHDRAVIARRSAQ